MCQSAGDVHARIEGLEPPAERLLGARVLELGRLLLRDEAQAVQLGVGLAKVKNTSKAMRGHFATASVEPKAKVVEFRVSTDNMLDVGAEITVDHFVPGQKVDVTGTKELGDVFTEEVDGGGA